MKKIKLSLLIGLLSLTIQGQEYMKDIAEKACECVRSIPENEPITGINFGICIIEEAALFKEELLRDYNIDMSKIDVDGEELGRVVAMEMFTSCPDQLKRFASMNNKSNEDSDILEIEGKINNIVQEGFVTFSLVHQNGKISKFYWLSFVESDNDIQNTFKNLEEKSVKIEYAIQELFDPRINEYRNFNIIKSLNIIQ